jgi:hypothetical protein
MNRQTLAALVVLNVVLLVALVVMSIAPPPVQAQGFARAQYVMVAGRVTGREQQDAVFVIELNTGRLAALFFNASNNNLEILGGREMLTDLNASVGRQR